MVFLKNLQNSQENTCTRDSFLNKIVRLRPVTLLKMFLPQVFSCEFCKISKTPFLQNTSGRLLLTSTWKDLIAFSMIIHRIFVMNEYSYNWAYLNWLENRTDQMDRSNLWWQKILLCCFSLTSYLFIYLTYWINL